MKDRAARSTLEALASRLPYPLVSGLGASFVFVWLLGVLFGRGFQIYPPRGAAPPEMQCPECRIFRNVSAQITERQYRIIYELAANLELTRAQAWRLLRLKVHGAFFDQELRAEDNCGIYSFMQTKTAHHFPLVQEGPTRVELYCIDRLLLNTSGGVAPWPGETEHSIFHANGELTNVCTEGASLVAFAQSRVFPAQIAGFASARFLRTTITEHANETGARARGFSFRISDGEIAALSWRAVLDRLLLPAFVESEAGATVTFRSALPPPFDSLLRRVTAGRYTEAATVCYRRLSVSVNASRVLAIEPGEYATVRNRIAGKYTNRTDAIVVNPADVLAPIVRQIPAAAVLSATNYKDMIKAVAAARAMVSVDDNDAVINAFWLPSDAPLLLVLPPKRGVESASVARLARLNRRIIRIWGDADGAISPMPELLAQCLNGTLDANGTDCEPAYRNLSYRVNPDGLANAIAQISN
jgi:hypothetical protein